MVDYGVSSMNSLKLLIPVGFGFFRTSEKVFFLIWPWIKSNVVFSICDSRRCRCCLRSLRPDWLTLIVFDWSVYLEILRKILRLVLKFGFIWFYTKRQFEFSFLVYFVGPFSPVLCWLHPDFTVTFLCSGTCRTAVPSQSQHNYTLCVKRFISAFR